MSMWRSKRSNSTKKCAFGNHWSSTPTLSCGSSAATRRFSVSAIARRCRTATKPAAPMRAKSRMSGGEDLCQHHGDVVRPAVLVGALDQRVGRDLELARRADDLADLLVTHRSTQAVGAEDVDVADLGL